MAVRGMICVHTALARRAHQGSHCRDDRNKCQWVKTQHGREGGGGVLGDNSVWEVLVVQA